MSLDQMKSDCWLRAAAVASWLALATVASGMAHDQGVKGSPRPGWKPRQVKFGANQLTAADQAAAIAKLEAIERVMLQVPELAHPEGYYVDPRFEGVTQPSDLGAGAPPLSRTVYEYR